MRFNKLITTVDTHTQGEATRIVTAGIGPIPGSTMLEKKEWMASQYDYLRQMLMWEPRGHQDMFGAILTEPCDTDAHAGVLFMDVGGYLDMCGHGSMGVATALLETGTIPPPTKGNKAYVRLDTPAGLIHCKAELDCQGLVRKVTIRNQPAFWSALLFVSIGSIKDIPINIAYGGNYFALVDAADLNVTVDPANIDELKMLGMAIRKAVNKIYTPTHPETGEPGTVALTEIFQKSDPDCNVVVFGDGQVDRSPCGTGTSAKMAFLYNYNKLRLAEPYRYQSIFGTEFIGRLLKETKIGKSVGVIPEITGSAYITGFHQFTADKRDELCYGFRFPGNHDVHLPGSPEKGK